MRWALLVLSMLPLAAQQGPNLYSRQKEIALGAELARQVERTSTPLNNPDALKYIRQMGARLTSQLADVPFPYTFHLIASVNGSPIEEPMALPGGHIFIPSNLFLAARDESELAGLVAHAMAHIADRDGTRMATPSQPSEAGAIPLVFLGRLPGYGTQRTSVAIPAAMIRLSNEYELEADSLAVRMAAGAGYDVQGLLTFLTRDRPKNYVTGSNNLDSRITALRDALQAPPLSSNDEFLRLQEQLRQH